jgi:hypothetical protein
VKRLVTVGVVMVLALAGLMAFRLFRLGPRDGLTVARVSVGPLGGRYVVTGYTLC